MFRTLKENCSSLHRTVKCKVNSNINKYLLIMPCSYLHVSEAMCDNMIAKLEVVLGAN